MKETEHLASVTRMAAVFLEKIVEADIGMQLRQYEIWREAASKEPLFDVLKMQSDVHGEASDKPGLVISDLLEGMDRLNNLALSETCLEVELEKVRPSLIKRLGARLQGRTVPSRYRLAPAKSGRRRPRIKMRLTVERKRQGTWRVRSETVPADGIASDAMVPVIE
jgi:hypothetical protein